MAQTLETDEQGYLLEPDFSDEVVHVIAAAEGITLSPAHWEVINYLREQYREHGHTPNFRNMLKGMAEIRPASTASTCTTCSRWARPSRRPRWPACRSRWARAGTEACAAPQRDRAGWPLRLKSHWFKTDTPKTPQQTAGAMAFIVWRVAHNTLKQMRSARFDIDIGPMYFAFMREVLVFLIQVIDRMAYERMASDERVAFTTALVQRVADHLADNENNLLGAPPAGTGQLPGPLHRPVQRTVRALRRLRPWRRGPGLRLHALPRAAASRR